ncbi:MAG: hypothetical protein HY784_02165 [Chloroflexi bacterium]|nr:hypothetical protein [Chloroflexota bacterium]
MDTQTAPEDDPSLIQARTLEALYASDHYRACQNSEPTAPPGSGLRVAVLHNMARNSPLDLLYVRPGRPPLPPDALDELDNDRNVTAYVAALRAAGHIVYAAEGNPDLLRVLGERPVDICFNTCEGFIGDSREAQVPALLEMLGVPYSGGRVMCMANTLDKAATKHLLRSHGLPTLPFQEFFHPDQPLDPALGARFPLFVKPNREGTSIGIGGDSRVHTGVELRQRVAYILEHYRQTALVEPYIPGRDLTVAMVGNLHPLAMGQPVPPLSGLPETPGGGFDWNGLHLFPISEINYAAYPPGTERFYSHKLKVDLAQEYSCYARIINGVLDAAVARYALRRADQALPLFTASLPVMV